MFSIITQTFSSSPVCVALVPVLSIPFLQTQCISGTFNVNYLGNFPIPRSSTETTCITRNGFSYASNGVQSLSETYPSGTVSSSGIQNTAFALFSYGQAAQSYTFEFWLTADFQLHDDDYSLMEIGYAAGSGQTVAFELSYGRNQLCVSNAINSNTTAITATCISYSAMQTAISSASPLNVPSFLVTTAAQTTLAYLVVQVQTIQSGYSFPWQYIQTLSVYFGLPSTGQLMYTTFNDTTRTSSTLGVNNSITYSFATAMSNYFLRFGSGGNPTYTGINNYLGELHYFGMYDQVLNSTQVIEQFTAGPINSLPVVSSAGFLFYQNTTGTCNLNQPTIVYDFDGHSITWFTIVTLPSAGTLLVNGTIKITSAGTTIPTSSPLSYEPPTTGFSVPPGTSTCVSNEAYTSFTFTATDSVGGSSPLAGTAYLCIINVYSIPVSPLVTLPIIYEGTSEIFTLYPTDADNFQQSISASRTQDNITTYSPDVRIMFSDITCGQYGCIQITTDGVNCNGGNALPMIWYPPIVFSNGSSEFRFCYQSFNVSDKIPFVSKAPTIQPTQSPSTSPTTSRPSTSPSTSRPSRTPSTSRPSRTPSRSPTTSRPSANPTTSRPSVSPTTSRPSTSPTSFVVTAQIPIGNVQMLQVSPTSSPLPYNILNAYYIPSQAILDGGTTFNSPAIGLPFSSRYYSVSQVASSPPTALSGFLRVTTQIVGSSTYLNTQDSAYASSTTNGASVSVPYLGFFSAGTQIQSLGLSTFPVNTSNVPGIFGIVMLDCSLAFGQVMSDVATNQSISNGTYTTLTTYWNASTLTGNIPFSSSAGQFITPPVSALYLIVTCVGIQRFEGGSSPAGNNIQIALVFNSSLGVQSNVVMPASSQFESNDMNAVCTNVIWTLPASTSISTRVFQASGTPLLTSTYSPQYFAIHQLDATMPIAIFQSGGGSQTVPMNVWTTITTPWQFNMAANGMTYNVASGSITVPNPGTYIIIGAIQFAGFNGGTRYIRLFNSVSGKVLSVQQTTFPGSIPVTIMTQSIAQLNANDVIVFQVLGPTSGSIVVSGSAGTQFVVTQVNGGEPSCVTASPTTGHPSTSPTTSQPSTSPTTSRPSVSPTTSRPSRNPSRTPSLSPITSRPSKNPSRTPSLSPSTLRPSYMIAYSSGFTQNIPASTSTTTPLVPYWESNPSYIGGVITYINGIATLPATHVSRYYAVMQVSFLANSTGTRSVYINSSSAVTSGTFIQVDGASSQSATSDVLRVTINAPMLITNGTGATTVEIYAGSSVLSQTDETIAGSFSMVEMDHTQAWGIAIQNSPTGYGPAIGTLTMTAITQWTVPTGLYLISVGIGTTNTVASNSQEIWFASNTQGTIASLWFGPNSNNALTYITLSTIAYFTSSTNIVFVASPDGGTVDLTYPQPYSVQQLNSALGYGIVLGENSFVQTIPSGIWTLVQTTSSGGHWNTASLVGTIPFTSTGYFTIQTTGIHIITANMGFTSGGFNAMIQIIKRGTALPVAENAVYSNSATPGLTIQAIAQFCAGDQIGVQVYQDANSGVTLGGTTESRFTVAYIQAGNVITCSPSQSPTTPTTHVPSKNPTRSPSTSPTSSRPSKSPSTSRPSKNPSRNPSQSPTTPTTHVPSKNPTGSPSKTPSSSSPSTSPTTSVPTTSPTVFQFRYGSDLFAYRTRDETNFISNPVGVINATTTSPLEVCPVSSLQRPLGGLPGALSVCNVLGYQYPSFIPVYLQGVNHVGASFSYQVLSAPGYGTLYYPDGSTLYTIGTLLPSISNGTSPSLLYQGNPYFFTQTGANSSAQYHSSLGNPWNSWCTVTTNPGCPDTFIYRLVDADSQYGSNGTYNVQVENVFSDAILSVVQPESATVVGFTPLTISFKDASNDAFPVGVYLATNRGNFVILGSKAQIASPNWTISYCSNADVSDLNTTGCSQLAFYGPASYLNKMLSLLLFNSGGFSPTSNQINQFSMFLFKPAPSGMTSGLAPGMLSGSTSSVYSGITNLHKGTATPAPTNVGQTASPTPPTTASVTATGPDWLLIGIYTLFYGGIILFALLSFCFCCIVRPDICCVGGGACAFLCPCLVRRNNRKTKTQIKPTGTKTPGIPKKKKSFW